MHAPHPVCSRRRAVLQPAGGDRGQCVGEMPGELRQEAMGPERLRVLQPRVPPLVRQAPGVPRRHPRGGSVRDTGVYAGVPGSHGERESVARVSGGVPAPPGHRDACGRLLGVRACGHWSREEWVAIHGRLPGVLRASGPRDPALHRVCGRGGHGRHTSGVSARRARVEPVVRESGPSGIAAPGPVARRTLGWAGAEAVRRGATQGGGGGGCLDQITDSGGIQPHRHAVLQRGRGRAASDHGLHVHGAVFADGLLADPSMHGGRRRVSHWTILGARRGRSGRIARRGPGYMPHASYAAVHVREPCTQGGDAIPRAQRPACAERGLVLEWERGARDGDEHPAADPKGLERHEDFRVSMHRHESEQHQHGWRLLSSVLYCRINIVTLAPQQDIHPDRPTEGAAGHGGRRGGHVPPGTGGSRPMALLPGPGSTRGGGQVRAVERESASTGRGPLRPHTTSRVVHEFRGGAGTAPARRWHAVGCVPRGAEADLLHAASGEGSERKRGVRPGTLGV